MARLFFYTLWWAKIWLQRIMCADQHQWHWCACYCERCGVTMEQVTDHSFAWRAPERMLWRPWGRA